MGLEALLVLLLFLAPGLLADAVYRFLLWRSDPEETIRLTRGVLFSAMGVVTIFLLRAIGLNATVPAYLLPAWWHHLPDATDAIFAQVFESWSTHVLASLLFALVSVLVVSRPWLTTIVRWVTKQSLYDSAWHEFAQGHFEHTVKVRLVDGRELVGRLGVVSAHGNRDVVLWNPYPYQVDSAGEFVTVTGTKGAFIPESQIAEVSVSYPPEELEAKRQLFGKYDVRTGEKVNV